MSAITRGPTALESEEGHWWWVYLTTGVLWLLFGFAILNGREEITTVWTVAVLASFLFFAFAISELVTAMVAEGWRWFHVLMCLASGLAGIVALAWPGQTFLTLAALIGWYLLAIGILHMAMAFAQRGQEEVWWIGIVVGLFELGVAFWAIGYPGRSIRLLIVWVAATALARGVFQILRAFSLRSPQPPAQAA